eukprot:765322-Hanusia_phi.AAC.5
MSAAGGGESSHDEEQPGDGRTSPIAIWACATCSLAGRRSVSSIVYPGCEVADRAAADRRGQAAGHVKLARLTRSIPLRLPAEPPLAARGRLHDASQLS